MSVSGRAVLAVVACLIASAAVLVALGVHYSAPGTLLSEERSSPAYQGGPDSTSSDGSGPIHAASAQQPSHQGAPMTGPDMTFRELMTDWERSCGLECPEDPLSRFSEAEDAWLARRGYPTIAALKYLEALDELELKEVARTSAAAKAVLSRRSVLEFGRSEAAGVLELYQLAEDGNVYALYELSRITHERPWDVSPEEPIAALQLAMLLGDASARVELYRSIRGMNQSQYELGMVRAIALLQQFNERRQSRGLGPLEGVARPHADERNALLMVQRR